MTQPDKQDHNRRAKEIDYEPGAFRSLISDQVSGGAERGTSIAFTGDRERMQDALNLLADESGLNIHRFNMTGAVAASQRETMGNLREAFDSASETASILVLDRADEVVRSAQHREHEENLSQDAQTELDYLLQRMESFRGICILIISDLTALGQPLPHLDYIVRF